MATYNYSDGNATFSGIGTIDDLYFNDDAGGSFDHRDFSFLQDGDDLVIYSDNGSTVTLEDYFLAPLQHVKYLTFSNITIHISSGHALIGDANSSGLGHTPFEDLILGGTQANNLAGSNGEDIIYGGGGNDTIHGDGQNDFVYGGDGDDTLYGDNGYDTIDGGDGNDTLYGGNDNDTLEGGTGNDTLYGDGGNDIIYGDDGNDTIYGGGGNDTIYGGAGNDTIVALSQGNGGDILYGGDGIDTLDYSQTSEGGITINLHAGVIYVNSVTTTINGFENIIGSDSSDLLVGNNADDNLIYGRFGDDTIQGRNSNDTLYGDGGDDLLYGGGQDDLLYGGSGDDQLNGQAGNDTLYGGLGQDVLRGQGGADTFVFESATALDGNYDILKDFSLTHDAIDISDVLSFDPLTDTLSDFVQVTTSGSNSFLGVDVDGIANGSSFVDIARIDGAASTIDDLLDFTQGDNLIVV